MSTEASSPGNAPAEVICRSAAKRMRAYRRRRRLNHRCVKVEVGPAELDGLVGYKYLSPEARNDVEAIGAAISDLIIDSFTRLLR
jgi:hypothetical protein